MKKGVVIKESELRLSIRKILLERLGVPEGILETSEKLYGDLMNELSKNTFDENQEEYEIDFTANYKINDLEIDSVKIILDINKWGNSDKKDYVIMAFSTPFQSHVENDSEKLKILSTFDEFVLKISFVVPKEWYFEGLIDLLKRDRSDIISSLSHELMHAYDAYKHGYDDAKERAEYRATQKLSFGIEPIDRFIHLLYFTHAVENIVRPSELAMDIKLGNVSQKDFLNFLKDNETYQKLDEAKNFSYEKLKDELKNYIPKIDNIGKSIGHDMGSTDEEKIDEVLRLVKVNLINHKGEAYVDLMSSTVLEKILGLQENKKKNLSKFIRKINKFENTKDFFKNEEKLFKFVADKMIRKISKLYDMTKSDNKSIKEWGLYHKVNKTDKNLTTEIKFKVK